VGLESRLKGTENVLKVNPLFFARHARAVPKLKISRGIFPFNCVQDGAEARMARSQALGAAWVFIFVSQKISVI
jgi:hypothetical protein